MWIQQGLLLDSLVEMLLKTTNWSVLWSCRTSGTIMSSWQENIWTSLMNILFPLVSWSSKACPALKTIAFWTTLERVLPNIWENAASDNGDYGRESIEWGLLHWLVPLCQFSLDGVAENTMGMAVTGLLLWVESIIGRHINSYQMQITSLDPPAKTPNGHSKYGTASAFDNHQCSYSCEQVCDQNSSYIAPIYVDMCRVFENRNFSPFIQDPPVRFAPQLTRYNGNLPVDLGNATDSCLLIWLKSLGNSITGWLFHIFVQLSPKRSSDILS